MTFSDWLDESRRRFREEQTTTAALTSLSEFVEGARSQIHWTVVSSLGGQEYTTLLAGERVHYLIDSQKEMRRARSAINEETVLEWLMEFVDGDTVVWDIGGYRGTYAVVAAAKGATTVAFEPDPENMSALSRNAALNDVAIDAREMALSDETTTRSFGSSDTPSSELRIHDDGPKSVETVRGDELQPRPDVVKLDVEGHECAVLEGMPKTLDEIDRILVEVHDGVDAKRVQDYLIDADLTVTELETPRSQTYLGGVRE